MNKDGHLSYEFKYPTCIRTFREPDIALSLLKDEEWRIKILHLLKKVNI